MERYSRVYREKVSGAWCWTIEDEYGNTTAHARCGVRAAAIRERDAEFRAQCLAALPAVHKPQNERIDYSIGNVWHGHTTTSVWSIGGHTYGAVHQQQDDGTRALVCCSYDSKSAAWADVRRRAADLRG